MKKEVKAFRVLSVLLILGVLILSLSFVSAGFFSNFLGKVTGKQVATCGDSDVTSEFSDGKNIFVKGINFDFWDTLVIQSYIIFPFFFDYPQVWNNVIYAL